MLLVNLKQEYLYIIVFVVLSIVLSAFLLLLSYSISYKKKNDIEKISAYECGFEPFGTGVSSFEVHFYIVGVLFIIFDLEIVFLYPWAVHLSVLGIPGFYAMAIFLLILTVGFIYEWQKGALDWSKTIVIAKKATKKNNFLIKSKQLSVSPGVECGLITNLQQEIPVSLELVDKAYNNSFAEIILLSGTLLLLIFSAVKFFDKNVLEKQKLITIWLVFFMALTTYFYPGASDLSWYSIIFLAENFGFISWEQELLSSWIIFNEFGATTEYNNYIILDSYTICIKFILILFTILFLVITLEYLLSYSALKEINLVEFPLVVSFALFFMLLLVSSFNIFGAYVSLEGITFSLYILAGMNYNSQNSLEAGIKYFCLGALSSGFLLFGIALIFIMTKTMDLFELRFLFSTITTIPLLLSFALVFLFFGFWFKLSIFPCHAWTPDVYEGVLTPVTLYFATIVKLSVFAFFVRVLYFLLGSNLFFTVWQPLLLFVAAGSILLGALGALLQTKIKRFVGYTSINQMGYLLIGVSSGDIEGLQASFLYLFFYLIMSFSFFSILLYVHNVKTGKDILFLNQLNYFGHKHRNLAIILALVLFSMAGIPPLAGFFGKFFLFFSAFKAGNHSLILLGLITNVVSAFYYLRLIKCMFFEEEQQLTSNSEYFFFVGSNVTFTWICYCSIAFFLYILLISPFFLNSLLIFFDSLARGTVLIALF